MVHTARYALRAGPVATALRRVVMVRSKRRGQRARLCMTPWLKQRRHQVKPWRRAGRRWVKPASVKPCRRQSKLAAVVLHCGRPPIARWTVAHFLGLRQAPWPSSAVQATASRWRFRLGPVLTLRIGVLMNTTKRFVWSSILMCSRKKSGGPNPLQIS